MLDSVSTGMVALSRPGRASLIFYISFETKVGLLKVLKTNLSAGFYQAAGLLKLTSKRLFADKFL